MARQAWSWTTRRRSFYEEYTPYGSTSYQAVRSQTETPKRYRYTGKERDEETGLSYHGARYYAPFIGRWTSPDPSGLVDGPNLFRYGRNAPTCYLDETGRDPVSPDEQRRKDDAQLSAIGVTRQQVVDFATMTHGDFMGKYGGGTIMGELRFYFNFPRDKLRALPGNLLRRVLPQQDTTLYLQPSGRVSTNADEKSRQLQNFNPGTPLGGVASVATRGVAAVVGASPETTEKAAGIAGAIGDVANAGLAARGTASQQALSQVTPSPAVQVGTTGRTPTVLAATTTGEPASPQARRGKVQPGNVNTGAPGVRAQNCGQCSGALLEGRGVGSSEFGKEGFINLPALRQQYAARGIQIGPSQTAATAADLVKALSNLPEGTNVQIGYDYAKGGGHWTTALVGKGGKVLFVEPQSNPAQVVNGPPPGTKNFDYFVVNPVQR